MLLFPFSESEVDFSSDGEGGTGVHIHIEKSVLNALLEKLPWAEVFESLNNKLSRTEETKHIREHIYKMAKEDNDYNHKGWNNWKDNQMNFNNFQNVQTRGQNQQQSQQVF